MSTVTVLAKQPPGGRCSLYLRYAEALREALGYQGEVRYCDGSVELPPPALLIGDTLGEPSDRLIVSPEDIARCLRDRLGETEATDLQHILETTPEQWMEAWSHA